jgi:hypothetical protein
MLLSFIQHLCHTVVFSCHICSILNGISGVTIMAAPPLISSLWFAPDERTTATAINQVVIVFTE